MEAFNLFAYCSNNPVGYYDETGRVIKSIWERCKTFFRKTMKTLTSILEKSGVNTTKVGSYLLNMQLDEEGIYHASFDCWQQYFGYNDFYDIVFDLGTVMRCKKFVFECNDIVYAIWLWKGDYINLGAGAEMGIYCGGPLIWKVNKSLAVPMSMSLRYNGAEIISYSCTHWWITGFNPAYKDININNLSASFVINFQRPELFWAFYYGDDNYGWMFNKNSMMAMYSF